MTRLFQPWVNQLLVIVGGFLIVTGALWISVQVVNARGAERRVCAAEVAAWKAEHREQAERLMESADPCRMRKNLPPAWLERFRREYGTW